MRGGAIDYYSNNVQVAPDGALAKVGVKSTVQILQVNNDTVSNWDELTDAVEKATKDSKTAPELTLKVKTDGQEKRSQSEANQVRESLLSGCDKWPQDRICG